MKHSNHQKTCTLSHGGVFHAPLFSFCSGQHQALHEEAGRCLPFTVATREIVGRCAVATRDIQPGELIFR